MKTSIVSISARNIHKTLAPWCLKAYCEDRGLSGITVLEASVNNSAGDITGKIYQAAPDIVAFSCYIWNIEYIQKIGALVKKLLPDCTVILGGPEVSFENDLSGYTFADYIIKGPGEKAFYDLLTDLRQAKVPEKKVIEGCGQDFNDSQNPYTEAYFESFQHNQIQNIENQLVYYESSRGCPFSCSYCLSSASKGVRYLSIEKVKNDLLLLVEKGAKCVKFVDRTFNSDQQRAARILEFVLSLETDCTFHFEAAADLFEDGLMRIIEKMPAGRIQFEIGVQSSNEKTLAAVNRKTDMTLVFKNISRLVSLKNCHVHVDLIAGLPYETLASFADAFDRCILCKPHMLQLGFLKMLKGTRIRNESAGFGAVFEDFPPYEVYRTDTLSCEDILKLKRIENTVDKYYNSGMFESSIQYAMEIFGTPFQFFDSFSTYCDGAHDRDFKLSLKNAYTLLLDFLLRHGEKNRAEYCIKLDCLAFDSKGILPDSIAHRRNKQAEALYRKNFGQCGNFRIEYFDLDNQYKLFNYENKHPLTKKFEVKNIDL